MIKSGGRNCQVEIFLFPVKTAFNRSAKRLAVLTSYSVISLNVNEDLVPWLDRDIHKKFISSIKNFFNQAVNLVA